MSRASYHLKIDGELLEKAKEKATELGLDGANHIIEDALRIYFANCNAVVWEKELAGGWVKKLIMRPDKVTFESIRSRKVLPRYNSKYYTPEALESKGWKKVWVCRKGS
jgi:hypothetical protein